MREAVRLSLVQMRAGKGGPFGAVVVRKGKVVGRGFNLVTSTNDPTAHAEIVAIRAAALRLGSPRLIGCDLYVTLEPCPMCAQAISFARIRKLVFAAYDPKGGGVEHGTRVFAAASCHHAPEVVGGVRESEAAGLLRQFFADRR